MKKALAILATVATVGGTMMSAPAEAGGRGIGPGLAFGLAAGAITAGAVAGFRSLRTLWAGLWLLRGTCLLRFGTVRLLRRTVLRPPPPLAALLVTTRPGASLRAFLLVWAAVSRELW